MLQQCHAIQTPGAANLQEHVSLVRRSIPAKWLVKGCSHRYGERVRRPQSLSKLDYTIDDLRRSNLETHLVTPSHPLFKYYIRYVIRTYLRSLWENRSTHDSRTSCQ